MIFIQLVENHAKKPRVGSEFLQTNLRSFPGNFQMFSRSTAHEKKCNMKILKLTDVMWPKKTKLSTNVEEKLQIYILYQMAKNTRLIYPP